MLPLVALVGRPNVGKSTLFNALTRSRDALVHDEPGVTRDRQYGLCRLEEGRPFAVCDTGGLTDESEGLAAATTKQTMRSSPGYMWNINHTVAVDDPMELFPVHITEAGV